MTLKQEWLLLMECLIATVSNMRDQSGRFEHRSIEEFYFILKAFQGQVHNGDYDPTITIAKGLVNDAEHERKFEFRLAA